MKKEQPKSVPVDPSKPENPVELLVHSANYLAREIGILADLASDGAECRSPNGQDVLVRELANRLATYRARGLQALVHVVNDVVAQHNAQVARIEELTPKPEQPATEQPATEQPATEQPATEQPATEQPAAEKEDDNGNT